MRSITSIAQGAEKQLIHLYLHTSLLFSESFQEELKQMLPSRPLTKTTYNLDVKIVQLYKMMEAQNAAIMDAIAERKVATEQLMREKL